LIGVERTDFVSVPVRDLERAKTFYGDTLGIRRNPNAHESYPEFETGNLTIALLVPSDDFVPASSSIALRVPDVAVARVTLEEAGVEFDGETLDTGVCHMAFFADPDGNSLLLHRRYAP
jgi:catechol 2,3-dioxygenase-like lactoylglutathione lyase family enzyme